MMAKQPRSNRIDIYIDRLESGDVQTRRNAALKLGRWPNIVVVKHLCDALQDSDRHVRRDAAKSLSMIGDAAAISALVQMVNVDTSVGAVRWGLRALGRIADPAAVSALLGVAVRAKSGLEITAREALDQIGIPAVGELTRSLGCPTDPIHIEAYEGIKRLYRRRRPSTSTFPGGPVVEAVMTAEGLRPQQRMLAIEAALSCRMLYRSPERVSSEASKPDDRSGNRLQQTVANLLSRWFTN
jgi:HEAT repeat protein